MTRQTPDRSIARDLFVSTACLPGTQPLRARIDAYVDAGIRRIELGACVEPREGDLQAIRDLPCRFLVHNYFPPPAEPFVLNLASKDPHVRGRSLDLVYRAIDLCVKLGAPFYSVHSGFVTEPTGFGETSFLFPEPESPVEESRAFDRFVRTLQDVLDHARGAGARVLVENNVCPPNLAGKLLLTRPDEFVRLFEALPDPLLGVLLDTGHLNVSARTFGFEPEAFLPSVADRVGAVHLHMNDGVADLHRPVGPGDWALDVLGETVAMGRDVILEAKFPSISELSAHVQWLQQEAVNPLKGDEA